MTYYKFTQGFEYIPEAYRKSPFSCLFTNPNFYFEVDGEYTIDRGHEIIFLGLIIDKYYLKEVEKPNKDILYYYSQEGFNKEYLVKLIYPIRCKFTTNWSHTAQDYTPDYSLVVERLHPHSPTYTAFLNGIYYRDTLEVDKDGNAYTLASKSSVDVYSTYAKEQIRGRYVFTERPISGLSNIVVDSFFPRLLYRDNFELDVIKDRANLPKTSFAISPLIASLLDVNQMPLTDIIAHFGYTTRTLSKLLTTVKRKHLNFVFAGVGGTGSNTIYWLHEMCKLCNIVNLFDRIGVFETENIEISNILRFPYPMQDYYRYTTGASKLYLVHKYLVPMSKNKPYISSSYYNKKTAFDYNLFDNYKPRPNTIVYGAPSLTCRNELSDMGNFICATHSANECSIWVNPIQTDDLAIETYGLIQLAPFFMNQVKLVLGTLELLASDYDLTTKDQHILDYSFSGTTTNLVSRTYNWQIIQNAEVLTDQQAMNF